MKVAGKAFLSGKAGTTAASIETAIITVKTILDIAPQKNFAPGSTTYTARFAYILAKVVGAPMAAQIMNGINPQGGPWAQNNVLNAGANSGPLNMFGPVNSTTILGGALLILDSFIKGMSIPYYPTIRKFIVLPFGVGLFAGGIAGGLLDPPGGSSPGMPGASTGSRSASLGVPGVSVSTGRLGYNLGVP